MVAIQGAQVGAGPSGNCEREATVQQVVLQRCSIGQGQGDVLQVSNEGGRVVLCFPATGAHLPWQGIQHPYLHLCNTVSAFCHATYVHGVPYIHSLQVG